MNYGKEIEAMRKQPKQNSGFGGGGKNPFDSPRREDDKSKDEEKK